MSKASIELEDVGEKTAISFLFHGEPDMQSQAHRYAVTIDHILQRLGPRLSDPQFSIEVVTDEELWAMAKAQGLEHPQELPEPFSNKWRGGLQVTEEGKMVIPEDGTPGGPHGEA